MTVNTATADAQYQGNGATTVFAVPFYFLIDTDLFIQQFHGSTGAVQLLVLNSDYTVTGAGNLGGGSITLTVAPPTGDQVLITRNVPSVQQTAYPVNDRFPSASHEKALDRLTMVDQQINVKLGLSLQRSSRFSNNYDLAGTQKFINAPQAVNLTDIPNFQQVQGLIVGGPSALLSNATGSALIGFSATGTGATTRTLQEKLRTEFASVLDYMTDAQRADVTGRVGSLDVTTAFTNALAANINLYVPPGVYSISGALPIAKNYQVIYGGGRDATVIQSTVSNQNVFTITSGLTGWKITDMSIGRTVTGAVGGNGIHCPGSTEYSELRNLTLLKHYQGIYVSITDMAFIESVTVQQCTQDGIFMTNDVGYGPAQWKLTNVLLQLNGRDGIRVQSTDGPAGLILGTWNDVETFGNSGRGINLQGSATTGIFDFRLNQAFIGADGLAGIRFDTHGSQHRLTNAFIESVGTAFTGPTSSTSPTNTGHGVDVGASEADLTITGSFIEGCSYCGIRTESGELTVSGCQIINNGFGATVGQQSGIFSDAGSLVASGCIIGGRGGDTHQKFGITVAHDNFVITGNRLNNNATSSIFISGTPVNGVLFANTPADVIALHPNGMKIATQGFGVVVGPATGGSIGVGTLNTSGGLLKNGGAYNNP